MTLPGLGNVADAVAALRRFLLSASSVTACMSIGWCRPWFAPHWDAKTEGAWAAAVLLRRAGFPHASGAVSTWAECERLLPHVLAVANHGRRLDVVNAVWRLCCVGRGAVWAVRLRS
jgi:hypothetical protein